MNSRRARSRPWLSAGLALVAFVAAAYFPLVFLGRSLVLRDAIRFGLPSREFLAQSLASGHIPEWLDTVGFGVPFAANPVHGVTYPPSILLAAMPNAAGVTFFILLHLLIAAAGTAMFARRLGASATGSVLAGGVLAASGYVSSTLVNGIAPFIAWTPWVAWAADRLARREGGRFRSAAIFAVMFAMQLLTGEPTSTLIAAIVALAVVWARTPGWGNNAARAMGFLVLACAGAVLLAAAGILPAMRLLAGSARAAGLDELADKWSMHPGRAIEWVWPLAYGSERHDGYCAGLLLARMPGDASWAVSQFIGFPVLFLAAAAAVRDRSSRLLVAASAVFVILALGSYTPVLGWLRAALPPFRWCTFPEKWIFGALFLWASLAGVGLARILEKRPPRWAVIAAASGALALGIAWILFAANAAHLEERLTAKATAWQTPLNIAYGVSAARTGGLVAFLGALLFAAALFMRRRALVVAAAVLAPLAVANWLATPTAPRALIESRPAILRALDSIVARAPGGAHGSRTPPAPGTEMPSPRLYRMDERRHRRAFSGGEEMAEAVHQTLDSNDGSRFGVDVLPGFEPSESAAVRRFWTDAFPHMTPLAFAGLSGVDAVLIQDPGPLAQVWPVAGETRDGWSLLATAAVRPRAFVTSHWFEAADAAQARERLTDPGRERDLDAVAIVNPDASVPRAHAPLVPCGVTRPSPERVILDCDSPSGGYAVLLEEAAPGWSATVDGRPIPICIADGLFRAVPVGAGTHRVEFRYRTPGLRAGAVVSLVSWIALGLFVAGARRRRSDRGAPESAP